MSYQSVREVLELSESRGAVRNVLLVLAEHAHEDGTGSFPSYDTIQAEANVGRGTIRPALEGLLELGEIQRQGRVRRSGTTVWAVTVARHSSTFELADGSRFELRPEESSSRNENSGSRNDDSGSRNSASSSSLEHEPSFEPPDESPWEPGALISRNGNGNGNTPEPEPPPSPAERLALYEEQLREGGHSERWRKALQGRRDALAAELELVKA